MKIAKAVCSVGLLFAAAMGTNSLRAQAPEITSPGVIEATPGETLTYSIEASNDPKSYNATAQTPNESVLVGDPDESGVLTITVAPDAEAPLDFVILVSAANEDGEQTQEVVLQVRTDIEPSGPGSARIFQGKLAVKPPQLNAADAEISSAVGLTGFIKDEGALQENPDKGTSSRAIITERVSNKTILELMKVDGLIPGIEGYKLRLTGQAGGTIADLELVAANRDGISTPVPETVFSFQMNEGIEGYKEKVNADGEVVQLTREQYVPVSAEWRNKPDSSKRIALTGIAKVVTKLKFYRAPGDIERSPYEASGLSVNLSGYGDGSVVPPP